MSGQETITVSAVEVRGEKADVGAASKDISDIMSNSNIIVTT